MIRYIFISLWIYRTFSYCGHWYSTSAKTQKLLLFLMHRFMTPYKFRFKSLVIVINQTYVSVSPSLSNKFDKNWGKRGKEPPLLEYSNNIISMLQNIKYNTRETFSLSDKRFLNRTILRRCYWETFSINRWYESVSPTSCSCIPSKNNRDRRWAWPIIRWISQDHRESSWTERYEVYAVSARYHGLIKPRGYCVSVITP